MIGNRGVVMYLAVVHKEGDEMQTQLKQKEVSYNLNEDGGGKCAKYRKPRAVDC